MIFLNLFAVFIIRAYYLFFRCLPATFLCKIMIAWKFYVPVCSTEDTFTFLLQYMKNAPHKKTEM